MKKDLIKSFLVYGIGDAFSKLVPFLLLPFFTEVLVPSEYGILEIINTIILIIAVLCRVQLDTSLQRFFYEEKNQSKLVSTIFWAITLFSLVLGAIAFLFSYQLSILIFENPDYSLLIKMAAIVVFLMNVNSYFSIVCRYLNMPIYLGLIFFAPLAIDILYGANFEGITPLVRILCIYMLFRAIGNPVGSLVIATGRTDLEFYWNVINLIIMPVSVIIGAQYSLEAVAISISIAMIIMLIPNWYFLINKLTNATLKEYLKALIPSISILKNIKHI